MNALPSIAQVPKASRCEFRAALRAVPKAAAVVSFASTATIEAFAAMSVAVLSSDPPLLMIGVEHAALTGLKRARARNLGVNVLSADQRETAVHFISSGTRKADGLEGIRWAASGDGAPVLIGALVAFDCTIEEIIERGDGAVILARIRSAEQGSASGALLFWRGAVESVGWSSEEIANAIGLASAPLKRHT